MKYPSYSYPVGSLSTGCSLGNYHLFVRFDAETNARGLWCADDNQFYLGSWTTDAELDGVPLRPVSTDFFPESQQTSYALHGVVLTKRAFLPFFLEGDADCHADEMHSLVYVIRIRNDGRHAARILLRHRLSLPAEQSPLFTKQPPADQVAKRMDCEVQERLCEIVTKGSGHEARVLSSPAGWKRMDGNDSLVLMEQEAEVEGGAATDIVLVLAVSPEGLATARRILEKSLNAIALLVKSESSFRSLLSRSALVTPDAVINRGIQWSKVNTLRVQHRYRIGEAFTNDPPQDIVVIRDLAWYVLGADYLTPQFSQNMLALGIRYGFHEGGKLTEYLHASELPPEKHDYKLNINDDTPLFVIALHHHAAAANGEAGWVEVYPSMRRAAEWIISQIRDGLVRCDAMGVNVWGICGWRNIIDGYTHSGAVTEVNAECYSALRCTADAARRTGNAADAQRYDAHANDLRDAINTQLVSTVTGMYLLNIDRAGAPHHEVTGDLIFPAMFGIAGGHIRERILNVLTSEEFWTPFGSRTVSRKENGYDPDAGYQLVGGIWHNLTAWTAYCVRHENPSTLVEGMKNIYKLSEIARPADFGHVVPGQFPERMHGENFVSRGMALSPWMPPTYLWLAIEGLAGVNHAEGRLEISPCIPRAWQWLALSNMPWKGITVTAVLFDDTLYANLPVESTFPVRVGTLVESRADSDSIFSVCMRVGDELCLFVASDERAVSFVRIRGEHIALDRHVSLDAGEGRMLKIPASEWSPVPRKEQVR